MTKDIAISCRGIRKRYGKNECEVDALKGIDLDIHKGELTLLVGPSGSGKTTLLSILTTILSPDAGDLFILGKDVNKMTDEEKTLLRKNSLGVVFQSLFLVPSLTIVENVALPLVVAGLSHEEANQKAMNILKKLHIDHKAHFDPTTLSRGQQQRVAIGRALVNGSEIMMCDEPTSSLDQASGLNVMELLRDLAHESRAIFVVTHDHRIFPYADRIITMDDGLLLKEERQNE